mgnify:CR=1 FL=1
MCAEKSTTAASSSGASASIRASAAPDAALGQAFNIACGERISLLELLARIGRIVGHEPAVRHAPPRTGDIQHSLAGTDKARTGLGYDPPVAFDEGLERTIGWYRRS